MHIPLNDERPFASGALSIRDGLLAVPLLAAAAAVLLAQLPRQFTVVVAVYVVCTVAYSMRLKEAPILDLIVLAFLFTLRLVAGMVAIDAVRFSPWLVTFSMFFFFSVASIKRYDEVRMMAARGILAVAGRGYRASDAAFLMTLGLTAGLCSTLVFFIYLADPASPAYSFPHPEFMWIICVSSPIGSGAHGCWRAEAHGIRIRCCSRCATACRSRWAH